MRAALVTLSLAMLACEEGLTLRFTPSGLPPGTTHIAACLQGQRAVLLDSVAFGPGESTLLVRVSGGSASELFLEARSDDGECGVLATARAPVPTTQDSEAAPLPFAAPPPFALGGAPSLCRVLARREEGSRGQGQLVFCDPDDASTCATPRSGMPAGCPADANQVAYYVPRGGTIALAVQPGPSSHFGGWDSAGPCRGQGPRCVLHDVGGASLPPPRARLDAGTCAAPHLCWESPLPQGNTLHGALVLPNERWVVGATGAALRYSKDPRFPAPGWTAIEGASADLYAVSGRPEAVWTSGANGQLLRFDQERLRPPVGSRKTDSNLYSLDATQPDLVWAAGDKGAVVRGQLVAQPTPSWAFLPVSAPENVMLRGLRQSQGQVFAVALNGQLLSGGAGGLAASTCAGESLYDLLLGDDGAPRYLVGAHGSIWRRTPQDCSEVRPADPLRPALRAIVGDAQTLWALGEGGTLLRAARADERFAPAPLSDASSTPAPDLLAAHLDGAGQGLLVGGGGALYQLHDGEWQREQVLDLPPAPLLDLNAVAGERRDALFAVGKAGVILTWREGAWRRERNLDDPPRELRGLAVQGDTAIAVGRGGAVLQRGADDSWRLDDTPGLPPLDLNGVALSATHVIVVGAPHPQNPNKLWLRPRSGATRWSYLNLNDEDRALTAVWAQGARLCVAAKGAPRGAPNVLCGDLQGKWEPEQETPKRDSDLNALWGSGPADLWAAGAGGVLLHRVQDSPKAWQIAQALPATLTLLAGASREGQVFISGEDGALWWQERRDAPFQPVTSGTRKALRGVAALRADDVLFVGDQGSVLRYIP